MVDAAAQRLAIAEPVAAFKWHAHLAVEAPDRVRQQLATLGDQAAADHIDRGYVTQVFSDQIRATEALEYSRFADWKFDPATAPAAAQDLSASRSVIDVLNNKILSQIKLSWSLLHSPACARQLAAANSEAIRNHQFDNLYQRALSTATASYCQADPPT